MDPVAIAIAQMGLKDRDGEHLDDKFTASLSRDLESIKSRTFDILFPDLKTRMFVPKGEQADPGAETITYRQWDEFGMAKIIANFADDLELVDALVEEFTSKVHSIGKAYQFSRLDLMRAAMSGNRLDFRRASAARRAIENGIEQIGAFGAIGTDSSGGLTGLLNNANVPVVAPVTGTWASATAAQIIEDMNTLVGSVVTTTKEVHKPDTLIMDQNSLQLISQKPVAVDNQTTVLRSFLANNPYIQNIDSWTQLEFADVAGTGPRMMAYLRSPEVLSLEIPMEFDQLPPEVRSLAFIVNCWARVGGVIFYYPLSAAYMDGI